jgi:hypothetical protein
MPTRKGEVNVWSPSGFIDLPGQTGNNNSARACPKSRIATGLPKTSGPRAETQLKIDFQWRGALAGPGCQFEEQRTTDRMPTGCGRVGEQVSELN